MSVSSWTKLVICILVIGVATFLTFYDKIPGEAGVGLITATLGYVFGNAHGVMETNGKMRKERIRKRPKILPDGRFLEVYEISFTSDKGINSTVDIPEIDFTPEAAREKAQDMGQKIDATLD